MKKKIIIFNIIISLLILIIIPQSINAVVYSDEGGTIIDIELITPRPNLVKEEITQFVFIVIDDTHSFVKCYVYTNYTNTWKKLSNDPLYVELGKYQKTERVYINLTNPGQYSWNVFCSGFNNENETWALRENRPFTIIPAPEIIINETLNTTINITLNLTNTTINNTEINITNNTTNEEIIEPANVCAGCMSDGICLEIGSLKESVNKIKYYCSSKHVFELREENKVECSENFECKSNYCLDNVCRSDNVITKFLVIFGFY